MSSRRRSFLPVAIAVNLTVAELLVRTGGRKCATVLPTLLIGLMHCRCPCG
jgi:hypothetical protein